MDASTGAEFLPDGPVRRMIEAANRHDLDAMVAEFAEDYENITPNHPARSFTGRAQVRWNWENLFAGVPDLRVTVYDATTTPDRTVWMEWGNRGTRRDGMTIEMRGVAIFAVSDQQIRTVRFYLEPVDHGSDDVNVTVQKSAGLGDLVETPSAAGR